MDMALRTMGVGRIRGRSFYGHSTISSSHYQYQDYRAVKPVFYSTWTSTPRRRWTPIISVAAFALGVLTTTTYYSLQAKVIPPPAPPPMAADSKEGVAHCAKIEEALQALDCVREYRERGLTESRPYSRLSASRLANSLTAGVLAGPGKFATKPIIFATANDKEIFIVLHIGRSLCGHDGIVHGGLLATILDEATARAAIPNLPSQLGVTANLKINYRAPARADNFFLVKSQSVNVQGRKSWARASIETIEGQTIAEAESLFIEPKWAPLLKLQKLETSL